MDNRLLTGFSLFSNFICTFAFINILIALMGRSDGALALQFVLAIAYSYANAAFMKYYYKHYQSFSMKNLIAAFFGGLYFMFKFKFRA